MDERGNKRSDFCNIKKAGELSGLSGTTIRKMFDEGKMHGYTTPTGQRRISIAGLQSLFGNNKRIFGSEEDQGFDKIPERINYIYTRVSTKKQLDDLSRQVEFTRRPEYSTYHVIQDVGSGINFKRKGLQTILESTIQGIIGEIVVAHRDRLSRFAFELLEDIIKKAGGKVTVLSDERNKSSEQELAEDLLAIVHIYSCRQMGRRKYKKEPVKPLEDVCITGLPK